MLLLPLIAVLFVSCSNYGEKLEFNKGEVYYTEGISQEMAEKLGNFLVTSGYFDGNPKSVQLTKDGEKGYLFRMVFQEEAINDPQYEQLAKMFSWQISQEILSGEPVTMEFTDDTFKTQKSIAFEPMPQPPMEEEGIPQDSMAAEGDQDSSAAE